MNFDLEKNCLPLPQDAALARAVVDLGRRLNVSFHALPIGNPATFRNGPFADLYSALLDNRGATEITITSPFFDTLACPEAAIARAEEAAARLFGADGTLFVTGGTTVSNQIVIEALTMETHRPILIDKGVHQSIHFALETRGKRVKYVAPKDICENSGRTMLDLEELVVLASRAENEGEPFEAVIINGQTYDGIITDINVVIEALAKASPSIRTLFIDEAWGAWTYFHPVLRRTTALFAGRRARRDGSSINVVATHSAHKSLYALRQASYLHYLADADFAERLRVARFRIHTTSPSYAILASLDLARAQMEVCGEALVRRCVVLALIIQEAIINDDSLSGYEINPLDLSSPFDDYAMLDPTKVSVRITHLPLSGAELRERLFIEYGVYISRCTHNSILLNLHIGLDESNVAQLLMALRSIQAAIERQCAIPHSNAFIIPYPPGVPLVVPGEQVDAAMAARLRALQSTGVKLLTIPANLQKV
jgi:arginine/lysine/ornithine decarboxylase